MAIKSLINKYTPASIAVAGIISYSNSFEASFHFDDFFNLVNNISIRDLSDLNAIFMFNPSRFIGYLSFAINYKISGLSLWSFHFVNISIHIITAYILFGFLILLFKSPTLLKLSISNYKFEISLFTALMFVTHPLATESVTYIIQRLNCLAAMWYLLSLYCYLKARLSQNSRLIFLWFFISAFAAVLAFFTKENSLSLPFLILVIEFIFFKNELKRKGFYFWIFLMTVATFASIFIIILIVNGEYFNEIGAREGHPFTIGIFDYWLSQIVVIIQYLSLMIIPVNQVFDYGMEPITSIFSLQFISSLMILLLALFLLIKYHRKCPLLSFGLIWFLISIAPQSIVPRPNLIFEYRAYLGIAGIMLSIISIYYYLLSKVGSEKLPYKFRKILPILIIVLLTFMTYQRNEVWQSEKTLWRDTLKKRPNNARAWVNLGIAYANEDEFEKAISCYTNAISIWPDYLQAYNNRGVVMATNQKYDEALLDFQKAIDLQKQFQPAWINKIRVLILQGQNIKANKTLDQALRQWPENKELLGLKKETVIN